MRVAVVTPYCGEDRVTLERCIASVAAQSVPCQHLLVADGQPQDWIDDVPVRHLRFDATHGDYGNVARGVGALLMAGEGVDAIAFLDADNSLDADHVETCLAVAQGQSRYDYVVAQRRFIAPDGSSLPTLQDNGVVDTNCLFLLRGAFVAIAHWALMPRPLAAIGDRVVQAALQRYALVGVATDHATVNYTSRWEGHYQQHGLPVPDNAKTVDVRAVAAWIDSLSPTERALTERLAGASLTVERR
jgi:hypothetical protein